MHPTSRSPQPLRAAEYYLLLALTGQNLHKYALKAVIHNISLGSVTLDDTQINRLISKFSNDEAFIELIGVEPAENTGKLRKIYGISEHGRIRLQEETLRLDHALKIARNSGVLDNETPTDIQRLMLDVMLKSDA